MKLVQIPFELLLEDPIYRKWLKAPPRQPEGSYRQPPWRVWVQRRLNGPWAYKDFETYPKAFNWLIKRRLEFWDAAINCKVKDYRPPIVKKRANEKLVLRHYWPGVQDHRWCGYCRRPTLFKHFAKHHNIRRELIIPYERYCSVCGAREKFVKHYSTSLIPQVLWGREELERMKAQFEKP